MTKPTRVNGVWRMYDTVRGGYVSWVKASTKSRAIRQYRTGLR